MCLKHKLLYFVMFFFPCFITPFRYKSTAPEGAAVLLEEEMYLRIHRKIFTSSNTQNNTISLSLDGGKLPLVLDLSQLLPFFVIGAYGIYLIRKS